MNSKPLQQLSTSIWPYLIADKKKLEKRVKIVPKQQQQQQQHPSKKQKISNTNGSTRCKSNAVEKPSTSSNSKGSSIEEGKKMLEWVLTPVAVDDFMR